MGTPPNYNMVLSRALSPPCFCSEKIVDITLVAQCTRAGVREVERCLVALCWIGTSYESLRVVRQPCAALSVAHEVVNPIVVLYDEENLLSLDSVHESEDLLADFRVDDAEGVEE